VTGLLKLTLSYTGFVMLAGAVLLTAGCFSLPRGVHPGVIFMVRSEADLVRGFAPIAASVMGFLLIFGLLGGWLLAGRTLAPLTRSPRLRAWPRPGRSPTDRAGRTPGRAIGLTEALLLRSRADQRSFTRERVDLSLIAEEARDASTRGWCPPSPSPSSTAPSAFAPTKPVSASA
jgi:hypothetical protein